MNTRHQLASCGRALWRCFLVASLVGVMAPKALAGTAAAAAEIVPVIENFMAENHVPGLSVGVLKDGKVALARGFGSANLGEGVAASENTIYPLASLTKQFTAAGIMLLAQQGKLSLDDALAEHVDDIPDGWRSVTVRQLLNHTSGIADFVAVTDFERLSTRAQTPEVVLGWAGRQPPDFPPGEDWKYSNTNYFLLGLIIQRASGRGYGDFMAEQIFRPLHMKSTTLDAPQGRHSRNRARGYVWKEGELQAADPASPSVAYSAGGLVGTVADFLKWQQALQEPRLLLPESRDAMSSPTKTAHGQTHAYGFGLRIHAKLGCISHSGHVQGASAFMASCPARKFAVILLANLEHANLELLSERVAETYSRP